MKCECPNLRCNSVLIRILGMVASCAMMAYGIVSGIVSFNLLRLAIDVFMIILGLMLFVADIYAFRLYGYVKFVYSPIGRGIFIVFIGFVMLGGFIWQMILAVLEIVLGLIYGILTYCNGGVPKPLMQRNVDDLPLNAELRFVDVQND